MAAETTFGASERPSDCLRAIARIWESNQPLGKDELMALVPVIEIAFQNLDTFRYQTINLLGILGARLDGRPVIAFTAGEPLKMFQPPPPDLPLEAFRR